ncbi:MAG: type II toxin-antitoxin system prevent-host-death family antitoxin, partial [Porticoccaceae bacterium]|nr:type II toxin-antitoxin system prevent-host-death family antitoxin [Porticoccaceae bacterium]
MKTLETYSSKDAQNQFGEVLLKAQHEPVCIKRYNKAAAYVVSANDFEAFQAYRAQQLGEQASTEASTAVSTQDSKQITVGVSRYPAVLHRSYSRMLGEKYILSLIQRGAVRHGRDGQLEGVMCERVPSVENGDATITTDANGKHTVSATFRILPDVYWADGSPVVADDFKLRWEIGCHPDARSVNKVWYQRIGGFDIDDDKTFTLHYRTAFSEYANILMLLPLNARLERPIFEQDPAEYRNNSLYMTEPANPGLWNGPYRLESRVSKSEYIMVRNAHWSGKQPYFDRIRMRAFEGALALESALLSGAVDMSGYGIQIDQGLAFEESHSHDFQVVYGTGGLLAGLEVNLDNAALADVRVRQAILYG